MTCDTLGCFTDSTSSGFPSVGTCSDEIYIEHSELLCSTRAPLR